MIADRSLSRCRDPRAVIDGVKRGLQRDGHLLIIEDAHGHSNTDVLWRFPEPTLRAVLDGFNIIKLGVCGNSRLVGHMMAGGGRWTTLPVGLQDSFEQDSPQWPVYTWALARR